MRSSLSSAKARFGTLGGSLLALVLFVLPSPSWGQVLSVEAEGRYWRPALSGKLKVSAGTVIGSEVDLKDDLGMEGENTFDGEVALRALRSRGRRGRFHRATA